ncbi:hypothetical protein MPSI1_000075 [Malassezia psittaci]|uniref:Major facilitator superfamily (MFS) profile domain-containing protein n=1 Tax=Malassezia psittaci TaxID=1821823 RepID=A0AAF0F2J0_9BASI|nr:hypothetical protein MPSI1_000075 [Malassezia psittaci]
MEEPWAGHRPEPAIKNALRGTDSPALPSTTSERQNQRRGSVGSVLSRIERAPGILSGALDRWQTLDAERGLLYESRVETTFEDDERRAEALEQPYPDQQLDRKSSAHSVQSKQSHLDDPPHDPYLVTWESTRCEHENPRTWTYWHKMRVLVMYAMFSGIGPWASSMASPAVSSIESDLHFKSSIESQLIIAIFVLALVFGPLVSAPVSETIGRRKVVLYCNPIFIVFNIGCAVAKTDAQMIVLRFFAGVFSGSMIPMGGGCISDLFEADQRGMAMAMYSVVPVFGPCIGPVVAGWIIQGWGADRWRWIFWTWTMVAGVAQVIGMLFTRETYAPLLLRHKAKKLRKENNDERYHSIFEKVNENWQQKLERVLLRPVVFLTTELVVLLPAIYQSIMYGCFYLLIASLPRVFEGKYHFSVGISATHNAALGVGMIIFGQIQGMMIDVVYKYMRKRNGGSAQPEYKLPMLMVTVFLAPSALLLFGWTAQYQKPWIAPDIGLCMMGIAIIGTILQVQMYMVDLMGIYASSAISANLSLRSLFGFGFTMVAEPLFNRLDIGWGVSLLALITAIFGIPSPFLLYKYGPALRRRSKYCVKT